MPFVGQLADAVEFFVHSLVQQRFRLGLEYLDHPLTDSIAVAFATVGSPNLPSSCD